MAVKAALKSPRRSLLFTPGDSPRKISKLQGTAVDAIIFDLEDAVAINKKEEARHIVCQALATEDFGNKERFVRINAQTTRFSKADLAAISSVKLDGLVIPKVDAASTLTHIDDELSTIERSNNWPIGEIRLLALIETAAGIMNLKDIAQSTSRLDALLFGAEDLAADMNAVRTQASWELFFGRSAIVTAAAAYGLQAIDSVFVNFRDLEGLKEDATFARNMGYSGKMAIHPNQTAVIDQVFSPSAEEVARAQQLLQLAAEQADLGSGVFSIDGQMVDTPMIRSAEQLLERARLCGQID